MTRFSRGLLACIGLAAFNIFGIPLHGSVFTLPLLAPVAYPVLSYWKTPLEALWPMSSTSSITLQLTPPQCCLPFCGLQHFPCATQAATKWFSMKERRDPSLLPSLSTGSLWEGLLPLPSSFPLPSLEQWFALTGYHQRSKTLLLSSH